MPKITSAVAETTVVTPGCGNGTRVAFAVYASGGHNFPPPEKYEPAAAAVIWAFFRDASTIAPLPS